jgi:hypothetical protein
MKPLVKLLNLFKWTEKGISLVADFPRSGRMIHLAVIDIDYVFHIGHEFLLRFHQLLDDGPVRQAKKD